jgi:Lrp/AsnC family transcriptional regulator for asnA, asnC and gidA
MHALHDENKKMSRSRSSAFILLQTKVGAEREVLVKLKETPNVVQANLVYSIYDIIVKVESDSVDDLKRIVQNNIRQLNDVQSTLTLIVYNNVPRKLTRIKDSTEYLSLITNYQ